jgi:hypothetical protein
VTAQGYPTRQATTPLLLNSGAFCVAVVDDQLLHATYGDTSR